jgi:hypothetical protein
MTGSRRIAGSCGSVIVVEVWDNELFEQVDMIEDVLPWEIKGNVGIVSHFSFATHLPG